MLRLRATALALTLLACGDGDRKPAVRPPVDPMDRPGGEPIARPAEDFPDEPFRAAPPVVGAAPAFKAPASESFKLANGLEVFLVERHALPIVTWRLVFPTGSAFDPPGKEGLVSVCLSNLYRDSVLLATNPTRVQAVTETASSLDYQLGSEYLAYFGDTLRPHLDGVVEVWGALLGKPALRQTTFDTIVNDRKMAMATTATTASSIASRVTNRLFWGEMHPNTRVATPASYAALTLADCNDFFAEALRAEGAKLYVGGDITRAEVEAKLGPKVAPLVGPVRAAPPIPAPRPSTSGKIVFVDVPGAVQSTITLRAPGPSKKDPDYFATSIMGEILAGSDPSSRIAANVREMRGYAYSAGGGFNFWRAGGYFAFSAPVRADATAESLWEILEEVRRMREAEVTDAELEDVRGGRIAALPARFERIGETIGEHVDLDFFGMPATYFRDYAGNYGAVTKGAVKQAAAKYLDLSKLQIVVAGDAKVVLAKLKELRKDPALATAEVVAVDANGRPLAP